MQQPDPRIVFATEIFVREIKRQWQRQHPSADPAECPVDILEGYHPLQRMALVRAIEKAVEASSGMPDAYAAWINLKTGQTTPA
jgi:hypothetical protein